MTEERKDSFAETVDTAASAAHTVKGAIKAGKAISGAAKGRRFPVLPRALLPAVPMGLWPGQSGPDASISARSLPSLSFCFCCRSCLF